MSNSEILTKITEINKFFLKDVIKDGDIVIDATMGNGYDTRYLAEKVGINGFVYSFDVQEKAIKSTRKKLEKEELIDRVSLILDGHENIENYVKDEVACVIFNLGYLPRADHNIITRPETTIKALESSLKLLKKYGVISIALYIGHDGGLEERNRVYKFVQNLDQSKFSVLESKFVNQVNNPPQLILIEKKNSNKI